MKQQNLPTVPPEWSWLEQAEQFFACIAWKQDPNDWTCDVCGRIDDHMGSQQFGSPEGQLCAWCNPEQAADSGEGER